TAGEVNRNKSIFIILLSKDKSLLFIYSIIPVQEEDILKVFIKMIQYLENFDIIYSISSLENKLWLDYLQITRILNLIRIILPDKDINVSL
ncbi:hypothetical protein BO94DRAFT_464764, partial [Aspergillus sclerotioniger CBS 115572]